MKLYDESIRSVLSLFQEYKGESMAVDETWPDAGEQNLVLRQDMAYELGGGGLSALSGIALTSSAELVSSSGVWLYGPDLLSWQRFGVCPRHAGSRCRTRTGRR
jgi:hypothetical protein